MRCIVLPDVTAKEYPSDDEQTFLPDRGRSNACLAVSECTEIGINTGTVGYFNLNRSHFIF